MGRHAAPKTRKPAQDVDGQDVAPKRKREWEDDDFAKAVGRFITAMERRASTNPDGLAYMLTLKAEMDKAITRAGHSLSTAGGGQFSLGEIANFLTFNGHRMSRQAAQQRWGAASIARKLGMPRIYEEINRVVSLADWRARKSPAADVEQVRRDDDRRAV